MEKLKGEIINNCLTSLPELHMGWVTGQWTEHIANATTLALQDGDGNIQWRRYHLILIQQNCSLFTDVARTLLTQGSWWCNLCCSWTKRKGRDCQPAELPWCALVRVPRFHTHFPIRHASSQNCRNTQQPQRRHSFTNTQANCFTPRFISLFWSLFLTSRICTYPK